MSKTLLSAATTSAIAIVAAWSGAAAADSIAPAAVPSPS